MSKDGKARGDGERVRFQADGRPIEAHAGQTVAAALWAHGDRALSRSIKYHRPRAWSCGIGRCNDCLMRVDGVPNVKTCMTPAAEGMRVEGQNAWPSVRRDLFRANDLVFRHGIDHHRGYLRPRLLYPLMAATMRRFAAWGRLPDADAAEKIGSAEPEALRPDVLVIGGGPAGMAAAVAAADAGAAVLLIEESHHLGGQGTRLPPEQDVDDPDMPSRPVPVTVRELRLRWRQAVRHHPRITCRTGTTVVAAYRNALVLAQDAERLIAIKPGATVVATGGTSVNAVFPHNDKPGVMSAVGCHTLMHRENVRPGERAVVYGGGAHGIAIARDLHNHGVQVATLAEPSDRLHGPADFRERFQLLRIPVNLDCQIERVHGFSRVKAVSLQTPRGRILVPCDLLVIALGLKTTPELFQSLGAELRHDALAGGPVPVVDQWLQTTTAGLFAAGDTAGIGTLATARASGTLAGLGAAAHVGRETPGERFERLSKRLAELRRTNGGPAGRTLGDALEVPA